MTSIRRLLTYARRYRTNVALNAACNIAMVFFSIASIPALIPFLNILLGREIPPVSKPQWAWKFDAVKDYGNYELGRVVAEYGKERALVYVCILIVLIFFLKNLFRYLSAYFIIPLRNGVIRDIRSQLFEKTLRLSLSYFSEERKGDLISRVSSDVGEIEWSILNVLETVVREPLMIAGSLGFMIYLSPSLTLFVFGLLLFTAFIIGGIGKTLKKESSAIQHKSGELVSILEETLSGMRVIKGFNAEGYQSAKFNEVNNSFRRLSTKMLRRRDLSSPMTEFLGVAVVSVLIWFGFKQVEARGLSPEGFIAFLYAFFSVIDPAKSFSTAYYHIQKGKAAVERIDKILQAEETISDPAHPVKIAPLRVGVHFRNVGFYYKKNEKQILKNIELFVPKGKVFALVGSSGAGKTTLADLLPRFYDVTSGAVLIDGVDVRDFRLHDLRSLLGVVSQEAILFNDTIYNNIVFGLENATEAEVAAAAKAAHAHDFIMQTERGYQTNIGDRGTKLSGGQRQRLTIARAILKNPDILILDEATSALDSESEQLVQSALYALMENRTAIVIAHRLSTIQHADEIIVLKEGEIVERGSHPALLALGGEYYKLAALQGFEQEAAQVEI